MQWIFFFSVGVKDRSQNEVHLTVICNRILMTPSGSVMAGIKALIPARTSHGSTQADPATDGLTTGLRGGHPGSRWGSCTSLNSAGKSSEQTGGQRDRCETPVRDRWKRKNEWGRKDSGIVGVERMDVWMDESASVCNLYADSIS